MRDLRVVPVNNVVWYTGILVDGTRVTYYRRGGKRTAWQQPMRSTARLPGFRHQRRVAPNLLTH